MELTPTQKHLVRWLKVIGAEEDEVIGIMLLMNTPENQNKLMGWMAENRDASVSDVIEKSLDIAGRLPRN